MTAGLYPDGVNLAPRSPGETVYEKALEVRRTPYSWLNLWLRNRQAGKLETPARPSRRPCLFDDRSHQDVHQYDLRARCFESARTELPRCF
jgi:hypothetical protein